VKTGGGSVRDAENGDIAKDLPEWARASLEAAARYAEWQAGTKRNAAAQADPSAPADPAGLAPDDQGRNGSQGAVHGAQQSLGEAS
jgi:hypothetical protein